MMMSMGKTNYSLFSLSLLTLLLSSPTACRADDNDTPGVWDFSQERYPYLASSIPECGLGCVLELAPGINASCSGTDSSEHCLCIDETTQYLDVLSCAREQCTIEDSIMAAQEVWGACDGPRRSRRPQIFGFLAVGILALLCVLFRLYLTWWPPIICLLWDDYIMLAVAILFIAFGALGVTLSRLAFGVDIWTVDPPDMTYSIKLFYASEILHLIITALTKISILWQLCVVFASSNSRFPWVLAFIMGWIGISCTIFVLLQLFQCTPAPFIWEGRRPSSGAHHCLRIHDLAIASAASSILQNAAMFVLPLPCLARLGVSWRSELDVMLWFSLGILIAITSCVRLWSIHQSGGSVNPTWDYTDAMILTNSEVAFSVIVASLPLIRVYLSIYLPRIFRPLGILRPGNSRDSRNRKPPVRSTTDSFANNTYFGPSKLERALSIGRIPSIVTVRPIHDENDTKGEEPSVEMVRKMKDGKDCGSQYCCPTDLGTRGESAAEAGKTGAPPMRNIGHVLSTAGRVEGTPCAPQRVARASAGTTLVGSERSGTGSGGGRTSWRDSGRTLG